MQTGARSRRGSYRVHPCLFVAKSESDMTDLEQIAADAVKQAVAGGATDAECTISEGDEFEASIRMREIENLKEAGSRGMGIRVLVAQGDGQRTGSSYTSDLSREGMEAMVSKALELASITTEDPHAGLPEA